MKSHRIITVLFFFLAAVATAQPSPNPQHMDPYGYQRFTPAMAIIIVVLIAALFFMGFFAIYIRQRHTEVGSAAANSATGRSRRAAARGLDASVIATFPTMEYSEVKGLKIGKGALECAVCICEFEEDETLRLLPKCDHVFHPECIDAWLESHTTCPVCRADLVPDPNEPTPAAPEPAPVVLDVEAQEQAGPSQPLPQVLQTSKTLNRNRTRSGGLRRVFPRSHSTGHSVVQAGESTERFTLRLPVEVRKVMVSRQLVRASSMVLPRQGSSRHGYRTAGEAGGSGRVGGRRLTKSDRWVFSSFLARMSSFNSPKVASLDAGGGERISDRIVGPDVHRSDANRPPV